MIKVLITMIFLHILEDFVIQGKLSTFKQKDFWKKFDKKYKNDYIICLILHGISWSFIINLPIIFLTTDLFYLIIFLLNFLIHSLVDHLKANLNKINLIQDQIIHLIQIIITWIVFIFFKS